MPARLLAGAIFFCSLCLLDARAQVRSSPEEEEKLKAIIAASQDPAVLEQTFTSLIEIYLQREECDRAQDWVNRARDRKVFRQLAPFLLEVGRCLEKKSAERARQLYQKIIADYPDETDEIGDKYSESARRRLVWLSGDRSWLVANRSQLVRLLRRAVQRHDFNSLRNYVSKVTFMFGACESEFLNSNLEEVAAFVDENYKVRIKVAPGVRRLPYHEGWYVLESHGWSAPYNYVYFLIQQISGGWEWIGGIYCDEPIFRRITLAADR